MKATDRASGNAPRIDALLPPEMARRAEEVGVRKAAMDATTAFTLAVLAGAFIALGGVFATTALAGAGSAPWGAVRVLAGMVFSVGLVLVVVGGAELFTGNNLIVMAWASRRVSTRALLRNWLVVFAGNFVGASATALLVYLGGTHRGGGGAFGAAALAIAHAKLQLGFGQAVALGVLCNTLVCLAVWLTLSARTTTDRVLAIVPPISAFVAAGFEHSVANMYFIPLGLLIARLDPVFAAAVGPPGLSIQALTWSAFLGRNLLPVTIGNVIGGAVLVGLVYWFIYLRARPVPGSLLDAVMPEHEFAGRVTIRVRASPDDVFRALREVALRDMPLAYALGTLRYLPGRLAGRTRAGAPPDRPFLEQLLHGGLAVLDERAGRELVVGNVGKFHQVLDQEGVRLRNAAEFHAFRDPAFQKLAMSIRIVQRDDSLLLALEHRTHALSVESRRAFARYWLAIKPMGNFVSWLLLRAVRRRAEAAARARGSDDAAEQEARDAPATTSER